MVTTIAESIRVELVEKEVFTAELVEKELIKVNLNVIDIIQSDQVLSRFVSCEVPTQLTSKKFQTAYPFDSNTLQVFFNGIKEKHITINSNQTFSLPIDFITGDDIEVCYIKS